MIEFYEYRLSVEGVSFLVATLCAVVRFLQNCWFRSKTTSKDLVFSVLNGASIIPFCQLVGGLFSQPWLDMAIQSKLSMALAGVVGLLFVLGEVIAPESLRSTVKPSQRPAANDDDTILQTVVDDLRRAMSADQKAAVAEAKTSKRLPKEIDGRLLSECRRELGRDLRHIERVAVRKLLLDSV